MKCKHLKLIMELIFIFILPLLFLLPALSIKNDIVYDNNGNYEFSNKSLIYNGFNYLNEEVYIEPERIYLNGSTGFWINSQGNLYNASGAYFVSEFYHIEETISVINNSTIYAWFYDADLNYVGNSQSSPTFTPSFNNYYYFRLGYVSSVGNISDTNLLYYWSSDHYTQYSPISSLKNLIINLFSIDDSFIFDIVFDYTFLWLIMFILWHFIYCIFDWVVHLVDKQRRRE